ncbi:hypothetical protein AAXE64_08400 [Priestia megaterium]
MMKLVEATTNGKNITEVYFNNQYLGDILATGEQFFWSGQEDSSVEVFATIEEAAKDLVKWMGFEIVETVEEIEPVTDMMIQHEEKEVKTEIPNKNEEEKLKMQNVEKLIKSIEVEIMELKQDLEYIKNESTVRVIKDAIKNREVAIENLYSKYQTT